MESFRPWPERFFNTGCLILFIPMQWIIFKLNNFLPKCEKTFQTFSTLPTNRLSSWQLSALDWFDQAPTGKIFQHRLIILSIPMQWNHQARIQGEDAGDASPPTRPKEVLTWHLISLKIFAKILLYCTLLAKDAKI